MDCFVLFIDVFRYFEPVPIVVLVRLVAERRDTPSGPRAMACSWDDMGLSDLSYEL